MIRAASREAYARACTLMPGGVNSPVRAFRSVGVPPVFAARAKGDRVWDEDGNEYIDFIGSWGPMLLGHSPEFLKDGALEAIDRGLSYGLPTKLEIEMAEQITSAYPAAEMVRMVNSGTEATMSAIRVARGYTGRDKFIKFEGCYHGHSDCLLVKSGSGTLTYGVPTSPGVPADVVKHTLVCRYNDLDSVRETFAANRGEVAAVIVEPVAGNMGVVPPVPGFLEGLREICTREGAVLIFDEVITGFRLAYGGASERFGVCPDMVCFGKIIGAGMPVGAYGGRRELMEYVSPVGPVYQAGTLSGNPLAMFMGLKQLRYLESHREVYEQVEQSAAFLEEGIRAALRRLQLPYEVNRAGSLMSLFFTKGPIHSYDDVKHSNLDAFGRYYRSLLERGILAAPAQFEALFVSAAHSRADLERALIAMEAALADSMEG